MNADYKVDLLVLGMGAAAELAAIYAHDAAPDLNILIATKALKGKGGCSRMVQGGFNVVLDPGDSHEKHLMDTLKGGQYINDQDLALQLVEQATPTVKELETICGCFFDRRPDGHIHQKAFAGQCFDRTVHKGDLTGIEIISRTTEQIFKRQIPVLEETRAVELLLDTEGKTVTGALLYDMRHARFIVVEAAATLVATGGGALTFQRNVDAFKEGGVIVLLDTPLRVLQLRLKNDRNRPLLQRPDRFRFIRELHQKRMPLYRRAADVVIPTKGSPNAVCRQVLQALEEKNLTNS